MAGYARARFGPPWADTDRNGCDQRFDVLLRDATTVVKDARPGRCKVTAISLRDPYTGATLTTTRAIQIDHVVPLAAAWRAGARDWDDQRRLAFATDEANLLAVDGPTNERKGDKTPDRWKPPERAAWCHYAVIYTSVSRRYDLSVTQAVSAALGDMLTTCPGGVS
jgi:hypothetical protein